MVVIRLKGGLGNQLFQYAAAYSFAKQSGQKLKLDPSFTVNMTPRNYKLSELCVDYNDIIDTKELPVKISVLKNVYINKACRMLNLEYHRCGKYIYLLETKEEWQPKYSSLSARNFYIDGYFQSEEYFKLYRPELLKQFYPAYKPENEYLEILDEIKKCNSVAVHVRQGDFKKDYNRYHYILGNTYYRRAISEVEYLVQNPTFFWFSDNINWVRQNFETQKNFRYISLHTRHVDIDEMMLMKYCKHIIAANSTFSWWASWLNEDKNAIHICPKKQYGNLNMIPKDWIRISVE